MVYNICNMTIINNKIKQAHAGNWGKPNSVEQQTGVADNIYLTPHSAKGKKKKKERKPVSWWCCPFCSVELPLKQNVDKTQVMSWLRDREDHCICGAYQVLLCPSCKHSTWFNPATEIYKHGSLMGCGFEGKKRQ